MVRLVLLATLVLLAASCGGSKSTSSTTTSTTSAAASAPATTMSRSEAINDPHPRVTARAYLTRCRTALLQLKLAVVAKSDVDGARQQLVGVKAACGGGPTLRVLAEVNPNDSALGQAAAAEAAIVDAATNFGHYLDHVANGTNGTKIFKFSVEEARQAKILLADAFSELK